MVDYSDIVYKCLEINTFYCEKDNNGNSVIYLKSPNCIHNVGDILHFADGINCSNASYDTVLEILSTVELKFLVFIFEIEFLGMLLRKIFKLNYCDFLLATFIL